MLNPVTEKRAVRLPFASVTPLEPECRIRRPAIQELE
jgi:hypothetical protein